MGIYFWTLVVVCLHVTNGISVFPFFKKESTQAVPPETAHQPVGAETDPREFCSGPIDNQQCHSAVVLNQERRARQHPRVVDIPGLRTSAMAAKFVSMSSRTLWMFWDDGREGVHSDSLKPGEESTTNSYVGHEFFFTPRGQKGKQFEIFRVKMQDGIVRYYYC
jgi:hypothetical protein